MANFNVNEKSRTISVEGPLTTLEREIIGTYVMGGYKVKEKRISKVIRLQRKDIEKYLKEKNKPLLKEFEEKEKAKILDKNGTARDSGFLKAMSWLKEKNFKTYDAIMTEKEDNPETTEKRYEREMPWLKEKNYEAYDAFMTEKENNPETTEKRHKQEAEEKNTSGETKNK